MAETENRKDLISVLWNESIGKGLTCLNAERNGF